MNLLIWVSICLLVSSLSGAEQYYERGELHSLTPEKNPEAPSGYALRETSSVNEQKDTQITWYRTEIGKRVGVDRKILVQWKDPKMALEVLKEFGLSDGEALTETIWTVPVPDSIDIFALSRKLYEHSSTILAHPNMIRERSLR